MRLLAHKLAELESARIISTQTLKPIWAAVYGTTICAYIALISKVPVTIIPEASLDDALFVKLAGTILRFRWLGEYDQTTLAKGPFYPLWIAIARLFSIPLLVAQATLYAVACFLLVRGLRKWIRYELLAFAVFVILLLNPIAYGMDQVRVIREGLYTPMTVLIMAACLWWVSSPPTGIVGRLLAVGFGIVLGFYWCTREEGLWIVPFLVFCAACSLLKASWFSGYFGLKRELTFIVLAALASYVTVSGFAFLNYHKYGVFDIVELKQKEFMRGYGSLTRIKHLNVAPPYVVVPRDTLNRIYDVSEAAAQLRPYFDSPDPSVFITAGCDTYKVVPCDGELRAGWFVWAMREAVAKAGYYHTAIDARDFYSRLASEIDYACDQKRLDCLPPRQTMAPPFSIATVLPTVKTMASMFKLMATFQGSEVSAGADSCFKDDCGQSRTYSLFLDMIGSNRFVKPSFLPPEDFNLRPLANRLPIAQESEIVATLLRAIMGLYQHIFPWMIGISVSVYAIMAGLAFYTRRHIAILAVLTGAALMVLSRIALMAYLDVTSIPTNRTLYLSPAYPALLLFGTLPLVMVCVYALSLAEHTRSRL